MHHLTLAEVLAHLGYSITPRDRNQGRKVWRDGAVVFEGTAHETWAWLRETGQIR